MGTETLPSIRKKKQSNQIVQQNKTEVCKLGVKMTKNEKRNYRETNLIRTIGTKEKELENLKVNTIIKCIYMNLYACEQLGDDP